MKHGVAGSVAGFVVLLVACQPEQACHGGRVLSDGTCVEEQGLDAGNQRDGGGEDASSADSGASSMMSTADAGKGATGPIPEAPYCSPRAPLVDEDKYGIACDMVNPGATCGSLSCQFGYCNKACTLNDPCSCPGGFVCTDFGTATACMPSWGWPCKTDSACRAEAHVCIEQEGYCTSVCDPNNPKTCPDTWKCIARADGNLCIKK